MTNGGNMDSTQLNLTKSEDVATLMGSSKTHVEWMNNAAEVMVVNGGNIPLWWSQVIVDSGLAKRTMAKFKTAKPKALR